MFFQTDTHVPFLYKQLAILALYKRIVNMAQMSYHKLWCKQWFHVCVMSCFNIYLLITQHFKIKFKSPFYQINKYSTQQNQAQYCLCLVFDKSLAAEVTTSKNGCKEAWSMPPAFFYLPQELQYLLFILFIRAQPVNHSLVCDICT